MALAYDNGVTVSSASNVSSLTSASWTISGSNTYLAAQIGSGAGTPVAPNACKWGGSGGTALTQVGSTQTFNTYFKHSVWELVGATAQSSTMYCSWPSNQDETALLAVSYTGVDQTTPKGTVATNQAETSASPTVTVTSVSGDVVVGFCYFANSNGGVTSLTSSQTERKKIVTIGGLGYEALSIADTTASGTSTVMTWTGNTTRSFAAVGFALKAASSGSTYNDTLTESATVDATLANAATFASGLTESATVSDSYSAGNVIGAALTESATLADDYAGAVSKDETLTESATLGDSLAAVQTFAEAPAESVTVGESFGSAQVHAEAFSEGVTAGDSLTAGNVIAVAFSESATLGESYADDLIPAGSYNDTISEGVTPGDAYASAQTHVAEVIELFTAGDSYAVTGGSAIASGVQPAGRSTRRRRVVVRDRVYMVSERDIPALLEAELLDRAPPKTAEVVEGPKPRRRVKKAAQPVKTVEQVQEAVEQIKARIEPENAWLMQALEAVAYRVLERLQDEEDSIMLLVA